LRWTGKLQGNQIANEDSRIVYASHQKRVSMTQQINIYTRLGWKNILYHMTTVAGEQDVKVNINMMLK